MAAIFNNWLDPKFCTIWNFYYSVVFVMLKFWRHHARLPPYKTTNTRAIVRHAYEMGRFGRLTDCGPGNAKTG